MDLIVGMFRLLRTPSAWLLAAALGLTAHAIRFNPASGFVTGIDNNHQIAILEWFYRSVALSAGPLHSPDFYYPEPGMLLTSEVPVVQGLVYTALRTAGANNFLAFNLALALLLYGTMAAAYAAFRYERFSPEASIIAAIFYANYDAWLVYLPGSMWYGGGFGLPLAWMGLTCYRRGDHRGAWWLAASLVVQFLASMTLAMAALLLAGTRAVSDPYLRRRFPAFCAACIPVAWCGLAYANAASQLAPYPARLGLGFLLSQQFFYRLDLSNFVPWIGDCFASGFSYFIRWPSSHDAFSPFLILWTAFASIACWQHRTSRQATSHTLRVTAVALACLTALSVTVLIHWKLSAQFGLPIWFWIATFCFWTGILWTSKRLTAAATTGPASELLTLNTIMGLSFLTALGPVIFVSGAPVAAGPAAFLDLVVPGFAQMRVTARTLLAGGFALCMLLAMAVHRFLSHRDWAKTVATLLATGQLLMVTHRLPWPDPAGRTTDIRIHAEACPSCSDIALGTVPLPYQWILAHGKAPLLELPASQGFVDDPDLNHDTIYLFYWLLDGIPRLNGVTSKAPLSYRRFAEQLGHFPDTTTLSSIRERGARWLVVHGDRYPLNEWKRIQAALDPPPEGLRVEQKWGPVWLFRVD